MKKVSLILVCILLLNFMGLQAIAIDTEKGFMPEVNIDITADGVYLKNLDTGEVMYEKNADEKLYPASLTKIMTGLIAIENTNDLDNTMVTYPQEVQDYLYTYSMEHGGISTGGLVAGEERSMREFLYATMLPSANEAAESIATHIGGSTAAFVEIMNQRATDLGMENTSYANPTGLHDENNYSTARDMAMLTEHALSIPSFYDIVTTYKYVAGESNKQDSLTWRSTIELQNPELVKGNLYFYEGIKGVKTGTIPESGHSYISTIEKDGFHYLLVLIGCDLETELRAFTETKAIYDWVFSSFRNQTLVAENEVVGEIPVKFSNTATFVQIETTEHFTKFMPDSIITTGENSQVKKTLEIPAYLEAPVKRGDLVGEYVITINDEEVGRVPVKAKDSLSFSQRLKIFDDIKNMGAMFWIILAAVAVGLILVGYIVLLILRAINRRKKRGRK